MRNVIGIAVLVAILIGMAWVFWDPFHECPWHRRFSSVRITRGRCGGYERSLPVVLKTLSSAQADFRANDRDGDGVKGFWKADVAGLYTVIPRGGANRGPIKLVELQLAAADGRPVSDITPYAIPASYLDYRFRSVPHADEKIPDPGRFAFCAYPEKYGPAGKHTFIVDEDYTIYKRDLGRGGGVEAYPTDEELRQHWTKLD